MSDATVAEMASETAKRWECLWIEGNNESFTMPDAGFRVEAIGIVVPEEHYKRPAAEDVLAALSRNVWLYADNVDVHLGHAMDWPQGVGPIVGKFLQECPYRLRVPLLLPANKMVRFRVEGDGLPLRIVLSGRWVKP